MSTITVRVSESEKNFFQNMANFEGRSLSEILKIKTLEQLEDEYDAKIGEAAYLEWEKSGIPARPMANLFSEYGV